MRLTIELTPAAVRVLERIRTHSNEHTTATIAEMLNEVASAGLALLEPDDFGTPEWQTGDPVLEEVMPEVVS